MRVLQEPAYVLHHHAYGETSLLLEVFTRHHGRLGLIAKGARRTRSPLRTALIPFQLLSIGFTGRGELPAVSQAEPLAPAPLLGGATLFCGLYLNELLMRLLHRHDPHERLFESYAESLVRLSMETGPEAVLRVFEKRLLEDIGYGLALEQDASDGSPLRSEAQYRYVPDHGPVSTGVEGIPIRGRSLLALAREQFEDETVLQEAKRLLRALLARHLGEKPLMSRQLFGAGRAPDALE